MLKKTSCWVVLMLLGLTAAVSFAGTIQGTIIADDRFPVESALVNIENSKGVRVTTWSDQQGHFFVKNLPADYYTVWLEKIGGLETDQPSCGYFDLFLDSYEDLNFGMRTTGIMIDFGDPSGGNGFVAFTSSSQIDFSVFMYQLESLSADTIDITGFWYIPGVGKLDASVINGWPAGAYAGGPMLVSFENMAGHQTHYTLRNNAPILEDGEIATFSLNMSATAVAKLAAAKGKLAFCGTSVRMYQNGVLVYSSTTNWVGNRADLTPPITSRFRRR